jgi:glycerol-3-phosphate acyltransferase PlsY
LGLFPAALTILGDAFKGVIPTYVAAKLAEGGIIPFWVVALVGVAAVLGHNYSIFLGFRGGAGGVTALGVLAAMSVLTAFVASLVAVGAILLTRYASAATFSGSIAGLLMLVALAMLGRVPWGYSLYGVLAVALISWSLRPNFAAIRAGTERKIGTSKG